MAYTKKAQVLLTEEEYKALEELAVKTRKKLGTLIREAIEKVYMEEKRRAEIRDSIDHLLSMPSAQPPEDYEQWEKEYSSLKSGSR